MNFLDIFHKILPYCAIIKFSVVYKYISQRNFSDNYSLKTFVGNLITEKQIRKFLKYIVNWRGSFNREAESRKRILDDDEICLKKETKLDEEYDENINREQKKSLRKFHGKDLSVTDREVCEHKSESSTRTNCLHWLVFQTINFLFLRSLCEWVILAGSLKGIDSIF